MCMLPVRLNACCSYLGFLKLLRFPVSVTVLNLFLQGLIDDFSVDDALEVKNIERVTNDDVKAVEYFLKQKCQSNAEVVKVGIHFYVFLCAMRLYTVFCFNHEF